MHNIMSAWLYDPLICIYTVGMKYLHQRDIIHRDLKSSNGLFTDNLYMMLYDTLYNVIEALDQLLCYVHSSYRRPGFDCESCEL